MIYIHIFLFQTTWRTELLTNGPNFSILVSVYFPSSCVHDFLWMSRLNRIVNCAKGWRKAWLLCSSKSRCFVKARLNCLPTGNFLAEVVTWGSLAWAIICSLWVLAFSLDPDHIFVNTFPSVIPNAKLITISNNVLLNWAETLRGRNVQSTSSVLQEWNDKEKKKETTKELHKSKTLSNYSHVYSAGSNFKEVDILLKACICTSNF